MASLLLHEHQLTLRQHHILELVKKTIVAYNSIALTHCLPSILQSYCCTSTNINATFLGLYLNEKHIYETFILN